MRTTRLLSRCLPSLLVAAVLGAQGRCDAGSADDRARARRIRARVYPTVLLEGDTTPRSLAARMQALGVPGLSLALIDGDRVAWAIGVGRREAARSDRPVTTRTRFQAASLSKPVAAVGALRLVDRGGVGLDDDVRPRLRSWVLPASPALDSGTVTLRHLLSHRAGIGVRGFPGYADTARVPTLRQVLDGEAPANTPPIRLVRAPGSANEYSGGGYTIVQQLVGDLVGVDFATWMARDLLRPLGMTRSTYRPLARSTRDDVADAHDAQGRPIAGRWHTYPEQAAASLWTTPCDYAAFAIALQQAVRGPSARLLRPATARAMVTPQAPSQGLGVGLKGEPPFRFSHTGSNEGYRAIMVAYLDRRQGVVVMTNGERGDELVNEVLRAVALEYGWPDLQPVVRRAIAVDSARAAAAVGRYALAPGRLVELTWRAGGLHAAPVGRAPQRLHAADDSTFFATFDPDFFVRLRRNATGQVVAIGWGALAALQPAARVAP